MSKLLPLIAMLGVVCCQSFAAEPLQQVDTSSVDASTLTGKVMCGYQGWFNCQGDGRSWVGRIGPAIHDSLSVPAT